MDDESGDEEYELEEHEGETVEVTAPSYRLTAAHIAHDLAVLAASVCVDYGGFFANVSYDIAAHINHGVQRRAFHEEAAREIETIIQEVENADGE